MPAVDEFIGDMLATREKGDPPLTRKDIADWLKDYGYDLTPEQVSYYLPASYPEEVS
jgi:hypothetical protein